MASAPPLPPSPPPLSQRMWTVLFLITVVGWAVVQTHGGAGEIQSTPGGATLLDQEVINIETRGLSQVDLRFDPSKPLGPSNPWVERQKKQPCDAKLEVELFELCWIQHGDALGPSRPRCPAGTLTHSGKCYFPISVAPRPKTSVDGGTER